MLLLEPERREIPPVVRGGAELVPLDQLVQAVGGGLAVSADPRGISVKLAYDGREVVLYDGKSLASVGGDLRLLSSPVLFEDGRWLVPIDTMPRLLGPLLGTRVEWRAASRVLVIGDVPAPRIEVTTFVSGDTVRVVLEASEKVPFRVEQEEGRVTVAIARDLVSVAFQQERLTGGIVESVQFLGGRENVFAVSLGRRFQSSTASEQAAPARLVLEFQAAPLAAVAPPPGAAPGPRSLPAGPLRGRGPPHGRDRSRPRRRGGRRQGPGRHAGEGRDAGHRAQAARRAGERPGPAGLPHPRQGRGGAARRAHRLRQQLQGGPVRLHPRQRERRARRAGERGLLPLLPGERRGEPPAGQQRGRRDIPGGAGAAGTSDLALILWDMAQAEHLEESSALATRIQEELAEVTGSQGRGIKQAPFRVLVGAAMPAVLVEVAFISNAEEEKLLTSDAYQNKVAAALVRGIARYHRSGPAGPARPPGRAADEPP